MEAIGDDGSGYVDNSIRFLRGNGLKTDVGPIAVLAVVCLLFCFVWYVPLAVCAVPLLFFRLMMMISRFLLPSCQDADAMPS